MSLVLIGYRGTGKTTVARLLALELGWDWVDADVEVELRAGRSIAALFAEAGERAFRDLETAVLRELVTRERAVIAAGGGAVLRAENRELLAQCGGVVWLTAKVDTIVARLSTDATTAARRPNLTSAGGRAEIERLLAEREPLYRACVTLEVATDDRTPVAVAAEIRARLDPPTAGRERT
ncbi:MAG: shikimate kinase [Planctomycetia bacterium]|nr:shikimate kinase [Planctomycetia bacterium]